MKQATVLLVEDEPDIQKLLCYTLTKEGYDTLSAYDGQEALALAETSPVPDLVLLDLMLPKLDGLEVCRRLKTNPATASIPVIMLTAKSEEADIVIGLELGADDYITKPFSPRVLSARVKAVLRRRREKGDEEALRIGDLLIDCARHRVSLKEETLRLTPVEFGILVSLVKNRGRVLTRSRLLDTVQGEEAAVIDRTIDVHIVSLRKKLAHYRRLIETVRGIGYRCREEAD